MMLRSSLDRCYQLADRCLQQGLSLPSDLAFAIANWDTVERGILYPRYQAFLQRYGSHLPLLAPDELNIVEAIRHTGVAVTSLAALQIEQTPAFLAAALAVSQELAEQATWPRYAGKHTLTATAQQLLQHPVLLHWGASEKILKIAEAYLGLPVAYDGLSFYHSVADCREAGPRKWHRDKEDWKMLKVCVYLHEVTPAGGPFECVHPAINEEILQKAQQKYQVFRTSELQTLLGREDHNWYHSYSGVQGTVLFLDPATFYHRGCPPRQQDRSAIFFGYFSRRPKHPFFGGRSPLSQQQLANFAQELPESVRDCVTWREQLKGLGRYIPKNYLRV